MKRTGALGVVSLVVGALSFVPEALCQVDDYEFMPANAWSGRTETGEDDASSSLAEGFEGLDAEVRKNTAVEPVDGSGGFDNVAPQLSIEEGPGGLEWDPSPTYRTRYKGSVDYPAGASQLQGNNWFTKVPSVTYDSTLNQYRVRFDANTFRIYDNASATTWVGRYGNLNSKVVGTAGSLNVSLYDVRGKTYSFDSSGRCTLIQGLGGARITIDYSVPGQIKVLQKPDGVAGSEVRRFTYILVSNRIDRIDVEDLVGGTVLYRTINFTYHEDVPGAVESGTGDLIGIEDEKLLSLTGTWIKRRWVFKYYTGTYNSSTNPGYPYQVKAKLGPESYRQFLKDNPGASSTLVYTKTAAQLASYVDATYAYFSDKRIRDLDLKSGCGCSGGEGLHTYTWDVNGSTPSDFITWFRRATITLPGANGSSRIIDYNKYGQTLNWIAQEVAGNPSSRRWIRTWTRDGTARLTESFSPKACTSYNDSTHVVTTNSTAGQRFQFAYDGNSALTTVKLRDPSAGNLNFQVKKAFTLRTSGDRRRFLKTSQTVYPIETTTDTGGYQTAYAYTPTTGVEVNLRTTTLPVISTAQNGSGSAVTLSDWFENDGLHTWRKDGDGFVHYTAYTTHLRRPRKTVVNLNTASPPSGVPAAPDPVFNTSSGLNLVSDISYNPHGWMKEHMSPQFTDNTNTSVIITRSWWYTKLSTDELVTIEYPNTRFNVSYYHAAVGLTLQDFEGHVLTSALGELDTLHRDSFPDDDFDSAQLTLDAGFQGAIVRRTERIYSGDKLTQEDVWIDADGLNQPSNKYTTTNSFDATGRQVTTRNAVGTITRWSYDVLDRRKTTKIGTIDGGGSDNMTLVEEYFYDDEEDTATNVGDGNLTRVKKYIGYQGEPARIADNSYDYRQRLTLVDEPIVVRETRTYTNRNQVSLVQRFDDVGSILMSKVENFYDAWGQLFETRTHGVEGGAASGYGSVWTWRNGREQVIKELSQGKVFQKTQYDGAGRVTNQAVSYDTLETAYADAFNLTGDTVIQETRYNLDGVGGLMLVKSYDRNHNGTGTGPLTIGTSGNSRPQFVAAWHDKLHRTTHEVNYGTNGGTDLGSRPLLPPTIATSTALLALTTYTIKSEVEDFISPEDTIPNPDRITTRRIYDDNGRLIKKIDNFVNGTPGPGTDVDRVADFSYNGINQVDTATATVFADTGDPVNPDLLTYGT